MIGFRQGKTITIECNVVDATGEPASLLEASAVFAYKSVDEDSDVVCEICTIVGSKVSYTLTSAITATLSGLYDIEIKLKDSLGNIDPVYVDQMEVLISIIPTCDKLI